jgi:tetratricopeptide (TPR) repeat protein
MWRVGETPLAIDWMREAINGLEAGGAPLVAAQHRVRLAGMLRVMGRLTEARKWLPEESGLPYYCLRPLLMERAHLHLAASEPSQAALACERLLPLWHAEPLETALTESLLAEACLDAGDHQRAGELSHKAAEVLGPWQHYEMATCLITIALVQRLTDGQLLPEHVEKARELIESDTLLHAIGKARLLDAQRSRLQRYAATVAPKQVAAPA